MKRLLPFLLFGAMLVVTGCPLQINNAIDEGSYTSGDWMIGQWTQQKPDGTTGKVYLIKKGDKPGHVQVYTVVAGQPEAKARPVVLSTVGSKIFISAYDQGDPEEEEDPGYYIYQLLKTSKSAFEIVPVKENLLSSSTSSADLKSYLSQHGDEDIYTLTEKESYKKN